MSMTRQQFKAIVRRLLVYVLVMTCIVAIVVLAATALWFLGLHGLAVTVANNLLLLVLVLAFLYLSYLTLKLLGTTAVDILFEDEEATSTDDSGGQ